MFQFMPPSVHNVTKITFGPTLHNPDLDFSWVRVTFENAAGEKVEMTAYSSTGGAPIVVVSEEESDG